MVSEDDWNALLPVSSREHFEQMFGIDYARLAGGGKMLAAGGAELGVSLFAASAGIAQLFEVRDHLQEDDGALFNRRASKSEVPSHGTPIGACRHPC